MKTTLAPFVARTASKQDHARILLLVVFLGIGGAGFALGQPAPNPMAVDARTVSGTHSNANGVLEPGETVQVDPSWTNTSADPQTVTGNASSLTGLPGPIYTINDDSANYGTVNADATADCNGASGNCYLMTVAGTRPATHWDAFFTESLSDSTFRHWTVHVGASFTDVPVGDPSYPFIETIFHNGVTAGCAADAYCPNNSVTRAQMAVFLLKAKFGASHVPPACTGAFADVPCPSVYADWIEELAGLGITSGCGGGNYCPGASATRAQMAVFLLKAEHGSSYTPSSCAGIFGDVPCPSPYADWIEQLSAENITGGCTPAPPGGLPDYCPGEPVTRGEMAVLLVKTFGLILYGPPQPPQVITVTWFHPSCTYQVNHWNFSPANIHIHAGDTVQWVWPSGGEPHSTTSGTPGAPDGVWDSGEQVGPFTFSHTFAEAGIFTYYCSHGHTSWHKVCGSARCGECVPGPVIYEKGEVIVDP